MTARCSNLPPAGLLAGALVLVVALLVPASAVEADTPLGPFPILFHVATRDDGTPVIGREALEALVGEVNAHFAVADITLAIDEVRPLPQGHAVLPNIRARRALRRRLAPHVLNIFVVDRIEDPTPSEATRRASARVDREPSGTLGGAHIEAAGATPATYILVVAHMTSTTLAHEIGHFFSAPHHPDPQNIMSYGASRDRFDDHQIRAFRARARRYIRRNELRVPR